MYVGISGAAFIPRFVQSRFASDSLYQSQSLSLAPLFRHFLFIPFAKVTFLVDGRPSNMRMSSNVFVNGTPKIASFKSKGQARWFNPFVPSYMWGFKESIN